MNGELPTLMLASHAMWVGDYVYFLSDRDGPVTLHAYDVKAKGEPLSGQ